MANKDMKTIKFGQDSADTYVVTDSVARAGLNNKQDKLISGTNIKTVNNQSLLGSGNIDISGGGSYTLPIASSTTLGGIKVGSGLTINSNGVLSANGGGGSSSMLVIEPTTITYQQLNWSQILEKAFDINNIFGLYFSDKNPSNLLIDSTSNWTIENNDFSIAVSDTTVSVRVGETTTDLYSDGSWYPNSTFITDENLDTGIYYDIYEDNVQLTFMDKNSGSYVGIKLNNTVASSIKNIQNTDFLTSANYSDTLSDFIKKAGILCKQIIFDSTFENNLVNNASTFIGSFTSGGINLDPLNYQIVCYANQNSDSVYNSSAWVDSQTFFNGCSWNLSSYTLTYPKSWKMFIDDLSSYPLDGVSDNIVFVIQNGGEIILPSASDYANQVAEIKDTVNNVDLMIYSTGTEWKFASDVLQLSNDQYNEMPSKGSLYGISMSNRWVMAPDYGLPAKLNEYNSWTMPYDNVLQKKYNNEQWNIISGDNWLDSFSSYYYTVTNDNSTISLSVNSTVYLAQLFIDVSDVVPTITIADGSNVVYHQDGEGVSSLTFTENTYYRLTINSAYLSDNWVIFVDCQSYTKPV